MFGMHYVKIVIKFINPQFIYKIDIKVSQFFLVMMTITWTKFNNYFLFLFRTSSENLKRVENFEYVIGLFPTWARRTPLNF